VGHVRHFRHAGQQEARRGPDFRDLGVLTLISSGSMSD
jgi:hypothetical protein